MKYLPTFPRIRFCQNASLCTLRCTQKRDPYSQWFCVSICWQPLHLGLVASLRWTAGVFRSGLSINSVFVLNYTGNLEKKGFITDCLYLSSILTRLLLNLMLVLSIYIVTYFMIATYILWSFSERWCNRFNKIFLTFWHNKLYVRFGHVTCY